MFTHITIILSMLILSLLEIGTAQADSFKELTICDNTNSVCWDIVASSEKVTWAAAKDQADLLVYNSFSDWHIPFSTDPSSDPSSLSDTEYNTIHSELRYLSSIASSFFLEKSLSNSYWMAVSPWDSKGHLTQNWQAENHDHSTWGLGDNKKDEASWAYDMSNGYHFLATTNNEYNFLAVRSYAVPEPTTGMLLTGGLGFLAGLFRRKKHRASN